MKVAHQKLKERMGDGPGTESAILMLERSLADSTRDQYTDKLNLYAEFMRLTGRTLPSQECDILVYIGWLRDRGTIQASSLQPYLSCINKLHVALNYEKPAVGEMIASQRRGMARVQAEEPGALRDHRVPIPAAVMCDVLALGERSDIDITTLRAVLAVCMQYAFFGRPGTGATLRTEDIGVTSTHIFVRKFKEKGKAHTRDRRVHQLPLTGKGTKYLRRLAPLLQRFKTERESAFRTRGFEPSASFWALPRESAPTTSAVNDWLREVLHAIGKSAPEGFAWQAHSLRSGAASAAHCIGVSMLQIRFMGGWAPNSATVERDYIDPTFRADFAASQWFGWLLPHRPRVQISDHMICDYVDNE